MARRLLSGLAERIVAHPRLARLARRVLARFPAARARLRIAVRNERARRLNYPHDTARFAWARKGRLDLSGEAEDVRALYQRLVDLRRTLRSAG